MAGKDLEYYLSLPYAVQLIPEKEEGGFVAMFPDLPGCLSSGRTAAEAYENAEDAKRCWLEAALEDGVRISEPEDREYSGQFRIRMPASLHRQLASAARSEGVSMNQYCIYLLTRNQALTAR